MDNTNWATTGAEAERHLLGAVLLSSGKTLDTVNINPDDYHQPLHSQIHAAAQRLHNRGVPPDVLTVADELHKNGIRFEAAYLHQIVGTTATPASAEHYAEIVRDAGGRRRALAAAQTLREGVEAHASPAAIQEAAQKALDGITPAASIDQVKFFAETIDDTIAELESDPVMIPTPWPSLDSFIGGLRPGALYTVGARTSVGKSVVGVQLAVHLAQFGGVPMISTEMDTTDLHTRALAAAAKVSVSDLENRRVSNQDWERIAEARKRLDPLPLTILHRGSATIDDMRRFITSTAKRRPLSGVVIDYLQNIKAPPGDHRPRWEYISDLTRTLKMLAMELRVPIIIMAQLSRAAVNGDSKIPDLHHLKESGSIEQDSDVVILLHRDLSSPEGQAEITFKVAKNRRGRLGSTDLEFAGHWAMIRDRRVR